MRQGFGVEAGRGLHGAREPALMLAKPRRRELCNDRLADAVMNRLEHLLTVPQALAKEPAAAEKPERGVRDREVRGLGGDRHRDRSAGHGDDLDQPPDSVRQGGQSVADHLLEGDPVIVRREDAARGAARELLDEQGAPPRLARDGFRDRRIAQPQERQRKAPGVARPQRADRELACFGPVGPVGAHLRKEIRRPRFLVSMREHEEDRWSPGRADEVEEQGRAVRVAPLDVIDADHERHSAGEGRQQITQSAGRTTAHEPRVAHGLRLELADDRYASQHGKQVRESSDIAGERRDRPEIAQAHQVATERVDDAVHGLEGHRLAFVRAPSEDDRFSIRHEPVEEVLEEGGLAHARSAADAHAHDASASCELERVAQRAQMLVASDEVGPVDAFCVGRRDGPGRLDAAEPLQDLGPGRASCRLTVEQRAAKVVQVRRYAVRAARGQRCADLALQVDDVDHGPIERRASRERLEENDPDAVPVGRGRRCIFERLLGCHVAGRADDLALLSQILVGRARQIGCHAEVEQNDPALRRDQHVGRFDIAMEVAGRMEGLDALDQLSQSGAEQADVRGRAPRSESRAAGGVRQEVRSRNELHREEDAIGVRREELVQAHEIGVLDIREPPELLLEEVQGGRVPAEQRLYGGLLPALSIVDLVDDAHSAPSDAAHDLEASVARPVERISGGARGLRTLLRLLEHAPLPPPAPLSLLVLPANWCARPPATRSTGPFC